ncbi:MAG: SDR family oxidoreductase [Acidimicrobiia bacterium]|nr:SDR family oxidoreductase [Acidimicrobiia bacterium]
MTRLADKVAIITGAGGGIGLAYARRFLAEGARVMVADIGEEQGRAAIDQLVDEGVAAGDVRFVKTDIADETSVSACFAATLEQFETVDILVNNAAIYADYNGSDHSLEYLRAMFDVNLHGQWLMARAVAPHLVAQRWGRIINVGSIAGYLHQLAQFSSPPEFELSSYAYQQTKWGVLGLTRHMAGQLGQYNVTVNCIAPGLTTTAATEKQVPTEFQPVFAQMSAMQRNPAPEHMVGAAVFFASGDADLVNGQILVVDGGNIMPV